MATCFSPAMPKGLNLAVSDVFYLSRALTETYRTGRTHYLDCYSDMALRRVWGAARMSWWLTMLLHRFPAETAFEEQMRVNQFDYLHASEHAQRVEAVASAQEFLSSRHVRRTSCLIADMQNAGDDRARAASSPVGFRKAHSDHPDHGVS
jgi:2-polyprenyl-6-methoxyphenol hydroxylase-like FAD-dependent oxidoreductase